MAASNKDILTMFRTGCADDNPGFHDAHILDATKPQWTVGLSDKEIEEGYRRLDEMMDEMLGKASSKPKELKR